MTLIAKQPYYKIIRELSSVRQRDIKEEREIKLYIDKVVTRYREFPIEDVLDMSYRNFGPKGGLLYLHTIKGFFPIMLSTRQNNLLGCLKIISKVSKKGYA